MSPLLSSALSEAQPFIAERGWHAPTAPTLHEAQRLIVEGFFAPVLDRIPLESVREMLRGEIERKIGT